MSYTITPARYSKGNMLVVCESDGTHFKTRYDRLAEAFSGRYTHREHGYIMSPKAAQRFEQAVKDGWNAYSVSGLLHDGRHGAVKHRKSVKAKETVTDFSKVIATVDTRSMNIGVYDSQVKEPVYYVKVDGKIVQPNQTAEGIIRYLAHVLYSADYDAQKAAEPL